MLRRSIGFKLIILIIAFSSACLTVFVYFLQKELSAQHKDDLMAQAHEIGDRVSRDIRDGMLLHGDSDTRRTLESIGYQAIVRKVRILDNKGVIAASTDEAEEGRKVALEDPSCARCHAKQGAEGWKMGEGDISECVIKTETGERIANVAIPIQNRPNCQTSHCHAGDRGAKTLGLVVVEISLESVYHRLNDRLRKNIAFAIILVAGLSGVGSAFIYWMIYLPLRKIINGTKAVAAGRLDEPIDIGNKRDEIGYLARSFNKMTERIRDMTGHLNRMNVELEHKVEERTIELKKTQESVMQSEKLASLGLMAAAIAHEINNPLTAVLTYSALLAKQAPDGSETKEDLEVIVSETTRCRSIVRGLLDFARETEFRQKSVNINQLLEETIALLKHQVMFQDIDIVRNMAAYLPDTIMDADQVKQVFINMMLNAADAMPNGGKLFVRTSSDYIQNEITIEFTDTGVGIPERDVKRIFDPFFTTKEKGRGTGLGLSVSYGIVQRHGGSIDVKSRVGQGTTFMITFPVDNTQ
ncbi:MAG: Sporulation kinase E [bacterium ADurb.Bin236]|nr:MAG: Sporulation kinase E [bacterium ADurb.Bin236]